MTAGRQSIRNQARMGMAVLGLAGLLAASACSGDAPAAVEVPGGNPDTGRELIVSYECGACHRIPGVEGADGRVAPGLQVWPNRAFIAGSIPNNPENVARYIQDPQEVLQGTEMPDLGVSKEESRHITAYLFTLR